MSKLPQVSGPEIVRALQKGSPIIKRRDEPSEQTGVPVHRQIDRGTLRAILRQSGITPDELTKLL